ncbi:MAG TPA: Holliday junction branch migration protein RuvA [Dehalococcoidia bacterium]|nr:Holliday junction branch migration protein RuvA [Dehalococcoidia bacterium]
MSTVNCQLGPGRGGAALIARLTGAVLDRGPDYLVVDVGGVGYLVFAPSGTLVGARSGADITLHTHLAVREDGMTLYGFAAADQLRLFQALLGVGGVGPKAALALLSVMTADELSYAIASGNAAALARAPGVGQKLASRVVLELRDKLVPGAPAALPGGDSDVVAALMGLGYTHAEAADAVARSDLPPDAAIEEKVRLALAYFARGRAGGP